jgi:hypothetical protein
MRRVLMFCGIAVLVAGSSVLAGSDAIAASPDAQTSQFRSACAASGLDPSEALFAYCVDGLQQQANPQYSSDSNATKAQNVCAVMGYGSSSACVGNLQQTLFDRSKLRS